jgi:hypothetical protein
MNCSSGGGGLAMPALGGAVFLTIVPDSGELEAIGGWGSCESGRVSVETVINNEPMPMLSISISANCA